MDPPQEENGEGTEKEEKDLALNTESVVEAQQTDSHQSETNENENHTEGVEANGNDKDVGKKRHGKKKNHRQTQMDMDPMFVPRDSRYFCHDIRGETSYVLVAVLIP